MRKWGLWEVERARVQVEKRGEVEVGERERGGGGWEGNV